VEENGSGDAGLGEVPEPPTWEPTVEELEALSRAATEAKAPPKPPTPSVPKAGPKTVADAFAALSRDAEPQAIDQAARVLQAALGDPASIRFYRSIARQVAEGSLAAESVAYALKTAKSPGVKNRPALFTATVREIRAAGGRLPEKSRPTPPPPAHTIDPYQNRETVVGHCTEAIRRRAAEGMDAAANRAVTRAKAAALADERGYTGEKRQNILDWCEDALAAVLDGQTEPSPIEALRASVPLLAEILSRRAAG
jgi:hypothetical protein